MTDTRAKVRQIMETRAEKAVEKILAKWPNDLAKLSYIADSAMKASDGLPQRIFPPVDLPLNEGGFLEEGLMLVSELLGKYLSEYKSKTAKHDPSRNGYQKKYQKKRYHSRKKEAIEILGGKCSICGSTSQLEFDHKNPDNKSFTLTKLWSVPDAEFKKELKKCRLLCRKHHLENTGKQRENGTVKSEPGKSQYGKDNKKKASVLSSRLLLLADEVSFRDAAKKASSIVSSVASSFDEVRGVVASSFRKSDRMVRPVITWNVFPKDSGHQMVLSVYGREKDSDTVKNIVSSLKEKLGQFGAILEYEDDLSEPGLLVKVVSGVYQ